MNRRRIVWGIAILAVSAALFILWQPSRVIWGTLAGDAFCEGYPTTYWGEQLTGTSASRANALARLEESGEKSLNVLRELLRKHPSPEVRWTVVELIGKLGPAAHAASDDVLAATQDKDSHVRALAAKAIPQIETPAAQGVSALIPLLESEHAAVVARALSSYRGEAKPALPALVALLKNESKDIETRWNAARTLGKLGPEGIEALPVLMEFTKHTDDTIREHAAEAIGDIGPTAVEGIPALVACLTDPVTKVRRDAVRSLGYLGEAARGSVPQIRPLLDDAEKIVRDAAQKALETIAPDEFPPRQADEGKPSPDDKQADQKAPSA